jgi:transcriptional regulator with XRE-family HTH domain
VSNNAIRQLRKAKGWTQEDLAHSAGLPSSTIRRLENGGTPQVTTAVKIANALGVTLTDLFPPASEVAS